MTMTLLDYSTDKKEIDRLPEIEETPKLSGRSKKIGLGVAAGVSVAASFFYGMNLNSEIGYILTAAAILPLIALIVITLFLSPRSEVSLALGLLAIIWGGVGATNGTLLIVGAISAVFGEPTLHTAVVVQAAIVEEFCKAMFLFGIFVFARQLIRTPLAGAALGILVGAGFAFVENIIYFNNAYLQGSWDGLWSTVILRAGMSFFLHSMATMCTGVFIGYVASKQGSLKFWKRSIFLDMGLLAAMTVHGLWNGMASLSTVTSKWHILYLFFWVPFVTVVTISLILIRKNYYERKQNAVVSAARRGYIKMGQAERINDKKTRKALYKASKSSDIVSWEHRLLRIQYWNDRLDAATKDRHIRKLNKAKSKDMMKFAQVVSKV